MAWKWKMRQQNLENFVGVEVYINDIIVWGKNKKNMMKTKTTLT